MTTEQLNTELAGATSPLMRCAYLIKLGRLAEAHEIAQNDESELGNYWHGIMHRLEGDYGNAKYWFRKAGDWPARLGIRPNQLTDRMARGDDDLQEELDEEWEKLVAEGSKVAA